MPDPLEPEDIVDATMRPHDPVCTCRIEHDVDEGLNQYRIVKCPLCRSVGLLREAVKEIIEYWDCGDDERNLGAAITMARQAFAAGEQA